MKYKAYILTFSNCDAIIFTDSKKYIKRKSISKKQIGRVYTRSYDSKKYYQRNIEWGLHSHRGNVFKLIYDRRKY